MQKLKIIRYAIQLFFLGIQVDIWRNVTQRRLDFLSKKGMALSDPRLIFSSKVFEKSLYKWKSIEHEFFVQSEELPA